MCTGVVAGTVTTNKPSRAMYASADPSGAHEKASGGDSTRVSWRLRPSIMPRNQIRGVPERSERYATWRPSGDQRCDPSGHLPSVRRRGSGSPGEIFHRFEYAASVWGSWNVSTHSTAVPSEWMRTSEISRHAQ